MANTSSNSFGLNDSNIKFTEATQEVSKITELFKGETMRISDTPETLLPPGSPSYDITIFCKDCSFYIDISNLQYHRAYHNALATLQFDGDDKPLDVQSLLNRRNQVIQIIKDEASERKLPVNFKKLKLVDDAYELIRNDLLDVSKNFAKISSNKVAEDVQSFALKCSVNSKWAVGIASSVNSTWKNQMEDAKVYQDYFGDDRNKCYLAIFDGYHGSHAALSSSQKLHELLLKEMAKFDSKITSFEARNFAESMFEQEEYELERPETRNNFSGNLQQESKIYVQKIIDSSYNTYNEEMDKTLETSNMNRKKKYDQFSEQMRKAFRNAYLETDQMLSCGIDESSKIRWSGTSAITCLIQHFPEEVRSDAQVEGKIYIANVGNSKALLIRHNKPVCITKDHTPNNPSEANRIHRRGGYITSSEKGSLVNGVFPFTRGLGNFGDKVLKDCITAEPYFKSINIDQSAQLLVLASSGVWQVFSDQEVASLLTRMLPNQQLLPSSRISESLFPLLASESEDCQGLLSQNNKERVNSIHSCNGQVEEINKDVPDSLIADPKSNIEENEEVLKLDLAKFMAEQLACAAMLAGSTENITVQVVVLPGCGPMKYA